jgi:protoporphyrin/coproporphyrin ferrochelatase
LKRTGVLLINLGTPDAPTPEAVGAYLREFLMDGFVIDMPQPLRWFMVNVMIVPRRKFQSANAYQKVQLPGGSPLLVYTREFAAGVIARLGKDDGFTVEYAMRYGNPSIASALKRLKSADVERVIVLPLYPQYAESSYETAVVETRRRAAELGLADRLSFFPPFYNRAEFIDACARRVLETHEENPVDHVLFSFHSLPERHLKQLDKTGQHCLGRASCCDQIAAVNQHCYRAQSIFTAKAIAAKLDLVEGDYTVSFQSRLGRAKWIGPPTEVVLAELARKGIKRLAVSCPSFVADCLETVEEIAIRGRQTFIEAGGEELFLVPSLNAEAAWVETVAKWIRDAMT